jgi:glycosyltransferase involved in cell wall biosynthesis
MGAYQRAQLSALTSAADVVIATTEALVHRLRCDAIHVPVGSNVTPVAAGREDARARIGARGEIVISLFGSSHPSRALEYAMAAISHVADAVEPQALKVLNLGADAPRLDLAPEIAVVTPGHLASEELSIHLHASDMLLLPFADGLSTRRTTLMAGLAHGLPVVGLRSAATDRVLVERSDALILTPIGDVAAYCDATLAMAVNEARRDSIGRAARELYITQFDWPVIASRVAAALTDGYALRPVT